MKQPHTSLSHASFIALAIALSWLAVPGAASAQMAGALGKPLPSSDLPVGTVSVRVIAGAPDKPLVGIDVTLVGSDGTERTARTDAEGRARFTKLEAGTSHIARAREAAEGDNAPGGEATSESFTIPSSGGIRLLISTQPWSGGGGGGGAAAPAAGAAMMDPRRMSGTPRGDPADPARRLTVAAVQAVVTNRIPDQTIHLVGYAADGSVSRITKKTGEDGRAVFDDLTFDQVAYYAMSNFVRGSDDAPIIDRTRSKWVVMPPQVGVRLLLAGLPADSTAPGVDDLDDDQGAIPPGDVVIRVNGYSNESVEVTLYEITGAEGSESLKRVATSNIQSPAPQNVQGTFGDAVQRSGEEVGSVTIIVQQAGKSVKPLPGMRVELIPVDAPATPATSSPPAAPVQLTSDTQGKARFTGLIPGSQFRARLTVHGAAITSAPFAIPPAGGLELTGAASWQVLSNGEARFQGIPADKVFLAEARFENKPYRSAPFMTVADRGTAAGLLIYPQTLFSFHVTGEPADEYMRFRVQASLFNYSYAPYSPGPSGLQIPLPAGFVQAAVADEDAERVKVEPDSGLIWRGTLPPGRSEFLAGWAMSADDGRVDFDMNLPMGVAGGSIILMRSPGMEVLGLPQGVAAQRRELNGRQFLVMNNITIMPQRSMQFSLSGLPQRPAGQEFAKYVVGVLVLVLLGWGIWGMTRHRQSETVMAAASGDATTGKDRGRTRKLEKKREQLLDDLVALEARKKRGELEGTDYDSQRGKLKRELERVYADLDRLRPSSGSTPN